MNDPVSPELKEEQMASSASLPAHVASATETDAQHSAGFEVHVLKTHPEPFAAVRARKKWLEIRRHDRNFKEGDTLWLDEYDPAADAKSGEVEVRIVTHVLPGGQYGIEPGFCAISMAEVPGPAWNRRADTASGGRGEGASCTDIARTEPHSSVLTSTPSQSEKDTLLDICDRLQDDGDRVYLGSTNDAEALRALSRRVWLAGGAS